MAQMFSVKAYETIYEAKLNREQQAISVWPYLQMWAGISISDQGTVEGGNAFSFNIANKGLGPAIIEELELNYKGKDYQSWYQLTLEIAKENKLDVKTIRNTLGEAGIEAGEVINAS
jgi:hypothetical protein